MPAAGGSVAPQLTLLTLFLFAMQSESCQLRELCMALLQSCTVRWQDPRDVLQTLAWRSHHGNSAQHILFPAIAHELQTACQLYAQVCDC